MVFYYIKKKRKIRVIPPPPQEEQARITASQSTERKKITQKQSGELAELMKQRTSLSHEDFNTAQADLLSKQQSELTALDSRHLGERREVRYLFEDQ